MSANKFSLSWIKSREPYDSLSRSDLLVSLYKKDRHFFKKILDLGGGNGSFLRWCDSKNIVYDDFLIIDHDQSLLKNFFNITKKYFFQNSEELLKINTMSYELQKKDSKRPSYITLQQQDILRSIESINNYNVISLSAVSDLLSRNHIKEIFNKIEKDKIIYFSICFDGTVKWENKNKYDKYIISMFNKHQQQEKTLGFALGLKNIEIIKNISLKKGFRTTIADSSWILNSYIDNDRNFQNLYLKTIYKPLRKYEFIDQEILKEWFQAKTKDIKMKKSNLRVGHKDILIMT